MKKIFTLAALFFFTISGTAQSVAFFSIPPDPHSSAMGYIGAGTPPDVYSIFWCPAKIPFSKYKAEIAVSNRNGAGSAENQSATLSAVAGYYSPDTMQAISYGLRYFDQGAQNFAGSSYHPFDYDLNFAYTKRFNYKFSAALTARYFSSSPYGRNNPVTNSDVTARNIGGDLSLSYLQPGYFLSYPGLLYSSVGLYHAGTKLSYGAANPFYQPLLVRAGQSFEIFLDDINTLVLGYEFNFFPLETKPFEAAKAGIGIEYRWDNKIMARAGYGMRDAYYGNVICAGLGMRVGKVRFEVSYSIPDTEVQVYTLPFGLGLGYNIARHSE